MSEMISYFLTLAYHIRNTLAIIKLNMKKTLSLLIIFLSFQACTQNRKETKKNVEDKIKIGENYTTEVELIGKQVLEVISFIFQSEKNLTFNIAYEKELSPLIYERFCSVEKLRSIGENPIISLSDYQRNIYTSISKQDYKDSLKKRLKEIYRGIDNVFVGDKFEYFDFSYKKKEKNGMNFIEGELHFKHKGKEVNSKSYLIGTSSILIGSKYYLTGVKLN